MPTPGERLRETLGLDLRSLALLRILLGVLLLVDLGIRAVDLSDHYTDAGILPREFFEPRFFRHHPARFSFHMMSGDLPLAVGLFVVAAACAVALSLGFFTRAALAGSLILCISLQNRNNEIETGGDYLLRLVCFWCLFLPLGARFSLDRRAGRVMANAAGALPNRHFSVATVGLLVQMMSVYFFSALHKTHPIWRKEFTALHYALHIDAYDTKMGGWLRDFPWLTGLLTRATLVFEFAAPWFLVGAGLLSLLPLAKTLYGEQNGARTATVFAFMGFHIGLGTCIALGTFPWFAALIWLGFLPTSTWDQLARRLKKRAKQSSPSSKDETTKWGAMWTARGAQLLLRFLGLLKNAEAPLRDHPQGRGAWRRKVGTWAWQGAAGLCLAMVVMINVATVEPSYRRYLNGSAALPTPDLSGWIDRLRLDQHWGLFAPYPRTSDGYYVIVANLADGAQIDLLSPNHELTWQKPDDVSGSYKTFRWRKYFRNLRRRSRRAYRRPYANYACRNYNRLAGATHEATSIEIYFMRRVTRQQGGHQPARKERLWRQSCPKTSAQL